MAAHFCPQCGHEVSSAARFCPNCAHPLGVAAPGPVAAKIDAAASGSRKLLIPALIAALVVLALALVLAGRKQPSVLEAQTPPPPAAPSVLSAPAPPPTSAPALTNAPTQPATSAPGLTNAPVQPAAVLPPDVAAYLTFLQGIEQRRVALSKDTSGTTAMLGAMGQLQTGSADPDQSEGDVKQNLGKISQGYADYNNKWQTLARDFRAVPPPQSCNDLANKYLSVLSGYIAIIGKTQVLLDNLNISSSPDYKALVDAQSMLSEAQSSVNTSTANADNALDQLCGRYGVAKPFTIGADAASPSLLGH